MKPTLIIGIGGSGMKIGHGIKLLLSKYNPELLLTAKNGKTAGLVKFLFIENDIQEIDRLESLKASFKIDEDIYSTGDVFYIKGFNAHTIKSSVEGYKTGKTINDDRYKDMANWLDLSIPYPSLVTEDGMRAKRQLGRMAFYLNYQGIRDKISDAVKSLKDVGKIDFLTPNSISIYIISSICGGTGSSLYLDVATLVNDVMGVNFQPYIKAIFINENYYLEQQKEHESNEYKMLQINSCAFIGECEYFFKNNKDRTLLARNSAVPSRYATRISTNQPYAPFTNPFIFDNICSQNSTIPNKAFYNTLADILYYSIISESNNDWLSYVETNKFDAAVVENVEYSSMGYSTIRFPKEELTLYFKYRYQYEIFNRLLFKDEVDMDVVNKEVNDFVKNLFQNISGNENGIIFNQVITELEDEIRSEIENVNYENIYYRQNPSRYTNEKNTLFSPEIINQSLSEDIQTIENFKRLMDKKTIDRIKSFDFEKPYNQRNSVADELRRQLWRAAYNIIKQQGYYALIGNRSFGNVNKGFLLLLKEMLFELYESLTNQKIFLENQAIHLEEARNHLLAAAQPNKLRSKKLADIQAKLVQYEACITNIKNNYVERSIIKLKQAILYEFAACDESIRIQNSYFNKVKISDSELSRYRKEMLRALGQTSEHTKSSISLLNVFDTGDNTGDSIAANYRYKLVNDFRDAAKDVFTYIIPEDFSAFIDDKNVTGWKDGSTLDREFRKNIRIDSTEALSGEFNRIFEYDDTNRENLYLITRFGEKESELKEKIKRIREKINSYLLTSHLAIDQPLGEFLNQDIIKAFNNCSHEKLNQIKQHFDVIYPIYSTHLGNNADIFVNVCAGEQFSNFIEATFNVPSRRIIINHKFENNKIVLLKYIDGIRFPDISGNKLAIEQYIKRNIDAFRPHLNYEWNNFPDGIEGWINDIIPEEGALLTITFNDAEKQMDYFTLLQLCYIIDSFNNVKPNALSSIFVENPKIIKSENMINKPPIYFDEKEKKFVFRTGYKVINEEGRYKFGLSLNSGKKVVLDLTKDNISFESSIKKLLKEKEFTEAIKNFIMVLSQDKTLAQMKKAVKTPANLKVIEKACNNYGTVLKNLEIRSKAKNPGDKNLASNFASTANQLLIDFFEKGFYNI